MKLWGFTLVMAQVWNSPQETCRKEPGWLCAYVCLPQHCSVPSMRMPHALNSAAHTCTNMSFCSVQEGELGLSVCVQHSIVMPIQAKQRNLWVIQDVVSILAPAHNMASNGIITPCV